MSYTWQQHITASGYSGDKECRETFRTRKQLERRANTKLVFLDLIFEAVHPSQWMVYPPSPEQLFWKGRMVGLLTDEDDLREQDLNNDWIDQFAG